MCPEIISVDNFDEIRALLGNINSDVLSDSTIKSVSFLQRAEAVIKEKITDYQSILLDSTKSIYLKNAVIYLTAYYLFPVIIGNLKSEKIGDYSYQNMTYSEIGNKRSDLLKEYDDNINKTGSINVEEYTPIVHLATGPSRII